MERKAVYGVLNVVAHPHPEGTYRSLFEAAGRDLRGHRFHGDRFATTSPITPTRNGVFTGRLATWTEIDENSNMIDKASLQESLLADSDVPLPENVGFNSRVFNFAFRENDHRLFIELKNDEGQNISIGRARKAILEVLRAVQGAQIDDLEVHLVSKSNAVGQVLAIPKLRKLEILLVLPNPDDLSPEEQKLIDELTAMNARRLKTEMSKKTGAETLILTPEYRVMCELAKDNGYVKGFGRDQYGEPISRNTNEYAQEIMTTLTPEESSAIGTRRVAEDREN